LVQNPEELNSDNTKKPNLQISKKQYSDSALTRKLNLEKKYPNNHNLDKKISQ
ncbi:15400_t:CDS:1, partial [Gigaspora rosea]